MICAMMVADERRVSLLRDGLPSQLRMLPMPAYSRFKGTSLMTSERCQLTIVERSFVIETVHLESLATLSNFAIISAPFDSEPPPVPA